MRKIVYIHGLESKQGGKKVDYLSSFNLVYAPKINYYNFNILEFSSKIEKPDLFIGSSIGGYAADILGSIFGVDVILFNPALHSRSIDLNLNYGNNSYKRTIVLGLEDQIINPLKTKTLEENKDQTKIVLIEKMGHRTSLNVFKKICNKFI